MPHHTLVVHIQLLFIILKASSLATTTTTTTTKASQTQTTEAHESQQLRQAPTNDVLSGTLSPHTFFSPATSLRRVFGGF